MKKHASRLHSAYSKHGGLASCSFFRYPSANTGFLKGRDSSSRNASPTQCAIKKDYLFKHFTDSSYFCTKILN
ncbi:hypothetical protein PAHAL_5G216000 [Panicum hallii]|uniref:Uncharacterized protein n=1 Tax=Panicum hallii TaxID=206008 RepID=A0A2T8IKS1_9POAL|nr:hypothetical protein PAHAL_5G216000 [Panicum hallii]